VPFAATLENLQKNTYRIKYSSIRRLHTTLVILQKITKKSSSKCLWLLLIPQVEMGIANQNPKPQLKAKERKSKKIRGGRKLYRHGRGWVYIRATNESICTYKFIYLFGGIHLSMQTDFKFY
jgi:hypothetical protein